MSIHTLLQSHPVLLPPCTPLAAAAVTRPVSSSSSIPHSHHLPRSPTSTNTSAVKRQLELRLLTPWVSVAIVTGAGSRALTSSPLLTPTETVMETETAHPHQHRQRQQPHRGRHRYSICSGWRGRCVLWSSSWSTRRSPRPRGMCCAVLCFLTARVDTINAVNDNLTRCFVIIRFALKKDMAKARANMIRLKRGQGLPN